MKLKDFKGIGKTAMLEFIDAKNVFEDYYEISLQASKGLKWVPGTHAIFSIKDKELKGKKWRAFSIASTAEEGLILLGTRTGKNISNFKKKLINMSKGDLIKMRGPFGWFTLQDQESPLVMIGMGVGITPIRALLKQLDNNTDRKVDLVYSSVDHFMFEDMINETVKRNKSFDVHYVYTIEDTVNAYSELAKKHKNNAYYYISGSQKAIKSVKDTLKKLDIKKSCMIFDPFLGY
ncbi:MAG: FAD-dependent oxidoreductase [Tenericutes bacterium]|nr:FAD-dependent oxidoreductase [Mycoplasmatota bacterium]